MNGEYIAVQVYEGDGVENTAIFETEEDALQFAEHETAKAIGTDAGRYTWQLFKRVYLRATVSLEIIE